MIPLMPTVALALFSLLCSAFVILRILFSILFQHHRPLGRRVYSLTSSGPLSSSPLPTADKSNVWLALCDVFAVAVFVWEAFSQWSFDSSSESSSAGSASNSSNRSRSAARLWLALTLRQTCLLIISALILVHVRRRKSVSLGRAHYLLWLPLLFFVSMSTVAAGLFTKVPGSFLIGYIVYSSTTAILNTVIFGSLIGSLIIIKRSLANFDRAKEFKSPGETTTAEKPRLTLANEEIDAIREGSLWMASATSSHRRRDGPRLSHTPHSTSSSRAHTTQNIAASSDQTTPQVPFPFLPPQGTHSSTSTRNPSPHRGDTHANDFGYAPFRNRTHSLRAAAAAAAALTVSSQGSWISSSLGPHPTLSSWSYPTQRSNPPNREQSAVEDPIALAGKQYAPSAVQAERGTASPASSARSQEIEISTLRILAWLAGVWAPLVFSLPYLIRLNRSNLQSNECTSTFLIISVTISSPILVLNSLLRHPIPIPYDMFDAPPTPRSVLRYAPSMMTSASTFTAGGYYYRRGSGTRLVTGRGITTDIKAGGVVNEKGYEMSERQRQLSILRMDDAKGSSQPRQGAAAPVHWHLPSRPAPTRVDSDSRRHSSIHPHDYTSAQQRIAPTVNDHTRVIRPTKSLSFYRL